MKLKELLRKLDKYDPRTRGLHVQRRGRKLPQSSPLGRLYETRRRPGRENYPAVAVEHVKEVG